jgi:hypothetical protein
MTEEKKYQFGYKGVDEKKFSGLNPSSITGVKQAAADRIVARAQGRLGMQYKREFDGFIAEVDPIPIAIKHFDTKKTALAAGQTALTAFTKTCMDSGLSEEETERRTDQYAAAQEYLANLATEVAVPGSQYNAARASLRDEKVRTKGGKKKRGKKT